LPFGTSARRGSKRVNLPVALVVVILVGLRLGQARNRDDTSFRRVIGWRPWVD
jgi:hypothetical protein